MSKLGRNTNVLIFAVLMAGCAGIPVVKKDVKDVRVYRAAKVLFQPNACGSGGDPATGGFWEWLFKLQFAQGSPAPIYDLAYDSLAGGLTGTGAYSLEPQADGSIILPDFDT